MRQTLRLLPASLLCLASAAAHAVAVPLPTKDATLNLQVFIQPQMQINENGSPNGTDASYDLFVRRTRLQVNGDVGSNFSYYFQVDNANFGKFGNYTGRMIVQDAWIAWGPFGTKGDNVLLVEGGLIFYPNSRFTITSSSNQPTVDSHPDMLRGFPSAVYPGTRSTGIQARGWFLDKKLGFRGGVYEGVQPGASLPNASTGLNPRRNPAVALFANFDIIGSEEGSYLYRNGTGSRDTGKGFSADLGFRYQFVRPYVSYEYFTSDDCPSDATVAQCVAATGFGQTGVHLADTRNFRAGLDFYINKAQNHFMVEFALNRGQSAFGPQSITAANAGYVPFVPAGQPALTSLARSPAKSLTLHWSLYF